MARLLMIVAVAAAFFALPSIASAAEVPAPESFSYEFPGCNGGGGIWPAATIQIANAICADERPVLTYGGHCNGRLDIAPVCSEGVVVDAIIADCFCD